MGSKLNSNCAIKASLHVCPLRTDSHNNNNNNKIIQIEMESNAHTVMKLDWKILCLAGVSCIYIFKMHCSLFNGKENKMKRYEDVAGKKGPN